MKSGPFNPIRIRSIKTKPTKIKADDSADPAEPGFLGRIGSAQKEAIVNGQEEGILAWPGITGTWGGYRSALRENGIALDTLYTGETVRNFSGGVFDKKGSVYEDNLDITLTLDTGKLRLWPGGTLFVYGLRDHGGDPSADLIGDIQTASNIEAPNQFIINEFWYQQNFHDDTISLLFGLHDLNSEFYVTDYGSLFLNSSFGIGPELSYNVPVSIFPKSGGAIRLRLQPSDSFYFQAAVYDGDPSTRRISSSEGKMIISEAGISTKSGKYKLGSWLHTANKVFNNQVFKNDYGFYAITDQEIIKWSDNSFIGAFIQWGWVPSDRNEITGYLGGGLHMHGIIPSRNEDDFGVAVARANTHQSAETSLEFTYLIVATPWLSIQPSFQLIRDPSGDPAVKTAKVGLLRFEIAL